MKTHNMVTEYTKVRKAVDFIPVQHAGTKPWSYPIITWRTVVALPLHTLGFLECHFHPWLRRFSGWKPHHQCANWSCSRGSGGGAALVAMSWTHRADIRVWRQCKRRKEPQQEVTAKKTVRSAMAECKRTAGSQKVKVAWGIEKQRGEGQRKGKKKKK